MENTDEAVPVGADEHEEAVLENGNEGEEQSSTNNEGAASAWKNSFTNVKSPRLSMMIHAFAWVLEQLNQFSPNLRYAPLVD